MSKKDRRCYCCQFTDCDFDQSYICTLHDWQITLDYGCKDHVLDPRFAKNNDETK